MSTDCRIFVLSNSLMKVSGCVPDIEKTSQATSVWMPLSFNVPLYSWQVEPLSKGVSVTVRSLLSIATELCSPPTAIFPIQFSSRWPLFSAPTEKSTSV